MDNTTKFFWLMRRQSLEKDLRYKKTLYKLGQKAWSEDMTDEEVAAMTRLEVEIQELERDLNDQDEPFKDTQA